MLGRAAVAMWWDVAPEMKSEWEDWHTSEHMPERLSIPGFLRGSRWIILSGAPSYFVLYEVEDLATMTGGAYLERLNNPSPWSRKMMPHHRNMVRSLCLVRAAHGAGLPHAIATIRFSDSKQLPHLPSGKGLTSAALLESQPMPGTPTTEQKIRGNDASAAWALVIGGYDENALARIMRGSATELPNRVAGLYRLAYSLIAKENP